MHLTLIISSLGAGGAERVISELANHWAAQMHGVTLITLASPDIQPFYTLDPRITLIQTNQTGAGASPFTRIVNIFKRIIALRSTIKKLKPDLVISFVDVMNITALLASRGLDLPVIVSERIDPHFHLIPRFYSWMREKCYPCAAKIIVQTQSGAAFFPSLTSKIKIIANPVRSSLTLKNQYQNYATKLVSVGRLDPQKDHALLIHAFAQLLPHYPDLTLTIYGEGPQRPQLESLITSLNLEKHVHLPGTIKDVNSALCAADLFVFPSRYEGFPNALCEAMVVGLPVIASACSGNVDVVRDMVDGRLFPVGDVDALVGVMKEFIDNPAQAQLYGEAAKTITERFHPDRIFAEWDRVIQECTHAETN